jgi:Kef-type K+ transport system membrane component KefB
VGSGPFWSAVWLFGLLVVLALLFGRLAARTGLPGLLSGLLGGAVSGLCYLLFYVATANLIWADLIAHLGTGALLFLGALAFAGAFMGWFWDRVA